MEILTRDSKKKGVFLDRDGTIIKDQAYLSDPTKVVLLPNAKSALSELLRGGFLLFLFTNQSGVGRGWYSMDSVHKCNERMIEMLELPGPVFTEICIAPEHPDEPAVYRKPSPRFIHECVLKYDLDRSLSWMVGDKESDVQTGVNADINSALVGGNELVLTAPGTSRFSTLYDFAVSILHS